jgi:Lrp/AsnC family leucine-responsive transcriptional regulator
MDNVDKKIVLALRKNARISLTELGQFINLSIPAVRTRLQRLETLGYIKAYSVILDPEKFGKNFTCFCLIQVSNAVSGDNSFEKFILDCPDILESHRIAGQYDYMLKIVTRSTKDMEELLKRMRANDNIVNISTFTVLMTQKEDISVIP